jgi:hypothetical protein
MLFARWILVEFGSNRRAAAKAWQAASQPTDMQGFFEGVQFRLRPEEEGIETQYLTPCSSARRSA